MTEITFNKYVQFYNEADWSLIPDYMRPGLKNFIEHGHIPGDFLVAVLENDLMRAAERADGCNFRMLGNYAKFLYRYAPHDCYGSRANVDNWHDKGGLVGMGYGV